MSKPKSGYFKGTTGNKSISNNIPLKYDKSDIIALVKLDIREHPLPYKQLNAKKIKALNAKKRNRTITKEEYKQLNWQKRLNNRRKMAIDSFWEREKELIISGAKTTRNWSASQIADIINGKRPKYKGVSMQSHHVFSVLKYPHLANNPLLIYPVTRFEHYNRWHGGDFKKSLPGKPINTKVAEEF